MYVKLLHWPSLFFSKVGNLQKKVLITPGLTIASRIYHVIFHMILKSVKTCRDSYMKDPEKSRARSRESYIKDPEKSRPDSEHEAAKVT